MREKIKQFIKTINILTKDQKEDFLYYLTEKVYKTERNISIFVALTQLTMIVLFLSNGRSMFYNFRSLFYMILYISLFTVTSVTVLLYRYTVKHKRYRAFLWIRRVYAAAILLWVLGITFLELIKGNQIGVYSYLLPTLAAVSFMTPIESLFIFGLSWLGVVIMLLQVQGNGGNIFGNMVNSIFVSLLALFISHRYYRSMTTEYCDRQIIENSNQLLQQMVHRDQLTGLYNRHFLREQLYAQYQDGSRKHWNGMFLMVDIDYFKQYNDSYGHIQGDSCLKGMAEIIEKVCEKDEVKPIRYGGEEFLLVKLSEESFDGMQFAIKLLQAIEAARLVRTDTQIQRVTVSAGLWCGGLAEVDHIETAIKLADQALYRAKSNGRNRIEVWSSTEKS